MESGRLVIWNPLYHAEPADANQGRPAQREAAEITEQMSVTGSEGTGEGVSQAAAADTDAAGEVEAAGHFRIYLGAAPGVGKTYAMLSEGQRRRGRGADVVAGFVEAYGRPRTEELINGLEVIPRKAVDYRGTRLEEMAAVTAAPGADVLLRRAARIASRVKGQLDVVHVIVGDTSPPADGRPVDGLRQLTADLGARWHEIEDDHPARAIVSFARQHQITQIVIGSIQHSWWHIPGGGPILRRVIYEAGACFIDVHLIARHELPPAEASESSAATEA